jgi:enamine deaminase RidA (YjgF/YER057c/UK114 family)
MSLPTYENPSTLAKPLGHYSHVARSGSVVMIAGQVGITTEGKIPEGFADQTKLTFENLSRAMESEGLTLRHVLKFTTYLTHEKFIPDFYAVRDEIFPTLFPDGKYPANTLLIISRLVKPELFVEIEAIGHA